MAFTGGKTKLMMGSAIGITKLSKAEIIQKLASAAIGDIDATGKDKKAGFAGWRHCKAKVDEAGAFCAGHLYFQLVEAERKINSSIFKDEVKRQELAYIQSNNVPNVPSKERKRIKDEIKERMQLNAPLSIKAAHVAIDLTNGNVYVDATSQKTFDSIIALFHKAIELEIIPMSSALDIGDIPPLTVGEVKPDSASADMTDFATWLWCHSEEKGKLNDFESMIEGPLTVKSQNQESKGSLFTTLRKGAYPQVSAEAKAALLKGKKLQKCKLTFALGKEVWSGNFNADTLSFSGLSLPEVESMGAEEIFLDNMLNLGKLRSAILLHFAEFKTRAKSDSKGLAMEINKWVEDRNGC